MSCSRRDFLAGASATGALIFTTGASSLALANAESESADGVRYGMIHDENTCIGCQACEVACREVNEVPEGVSRLEIIRTGPIGDYPDVEYQFTRNSCQHCDNAPCVHVCPTGAAYKDPETGIVDVEKDKCIGCMYCLAACPYQIRFIHPENKSADKCNFCRDTNLAQGKQPACVEICPTKSLTFGNLDDPNSEVSQMLTQKQVFRAKSELGTEPKLYRIPSDKGEVKG